ncbi:MAG TPA: glycoside hydrolase family 15 protein [Steroidobacteraceae bacterium]
MKPPTSLELGVIGNCEIAALVDASARIVWACLPRLDGDPVFCALLSREGGDAADGVFAVELQHVAHTEQRYLRNTAILETLLDDGQGNVLRVLDFCPRFRRRGRFFRPMMLVRIIEPVAGRPVARLRLRPRCDYGAREPEISSGSHHLSYVSARARYRLTTDCSLTAIADQSPIVVDQPIAFLIGPDETVEESPHLFAHSLLDATRIYWQEWVRGLSVPAEWQDAVIRAAITLKLCTYEDTGAVLAALTTSIPESPHSGRNWDYRYCWLRDGYFVVNALNRLGATQTMEGYLHFMDHIVARGDGAGMQPLFGLSGDAKLPERIEPALEGYRGMGPVRVGNDAYLQRQHDVYGSAILACTQLFFDHRLAMPGDAALFDRLQTFGEHAESTVGVADAGPWEFRGREQIHTFSSAMSWAGCDRLSRIAGSLGLAAQASEWGARAAHMRERVLAGAWNPQVRAFTSSFGGSDLDATALLLPELGFIPADDPRFLQTLAAIERTLLHGDWLYRYRHPDDFGRPASAFTVCGFWYIHALAAVGRHDEARERFERMLAGRTRLGLLSEDVDPDSGELWGNFPQTYSMVGIVSSAVRLSRGWEDLV